MELRARIIGLWVLRKVLLPHYLSLLLTFSYPLCQNQLIWQGSRRYPQGLLACILSSPSSGASGDPDHTLWLGLGPL